MLNLKNSIKNHFPLWQYLNQPLFHSKTILNPWKFWHNYQVSLLERCWQNDFVKELENCWHFNLTPLNSCCQLDNDSK